MEPLNFSDPRALMARIGWRIRRMILRLEPKQFNEREFWLGMLALCEDWYDGKIEHLYGEPCPKPEQKVKKSTKRLSALWTYHNVVERGTNHYVRNLLLPPDAFDGMKLLDIGCGPFGAPLCFTGCQIWGVDPLTGIYRRLGYPVDDWDDRMTYLDVSAEQIPVADGFFDAVIAHNSIDHVDDLPKVAGELKRVLKKGGIIRMQVHYHEPQSCEPWSIDDDLMEQLFGPFGIQKLSHLTLAEALPAFATRTDEFMTVWGNTDTVYRPGVPHNA